VYGKSDGGDWENERRAERFVSVYYLSRSRGNLGEIPTQRKNRLMRSDTTRSSLSGAEEPELVNSIF